MFMRRRKTNKKKTTMYFMYLFEFFCILGYCHELSIIGLEHSYG